MGPNYSVAEVDYDRSLKTGFRLGIPVEKIAFKGIDETVKEEAVTAFAKRSLDADIVSVRF